ncbi:MAG: hypothetical protein R3Y67_06870 [Eubacteriales bacterium]
MSNFINFFNSFASYVLLLLIFVIVSIVAVKIGIILRKRKDEKDALLADAQVKLSE